MQKNRWNRKFDWIRVSTSGSTYYFQENRLELYEQDKVIAVGDIYFKLNKYLTGVTFRYINNLENIYKIDLLTGDGYSLYNMYNEYDLIDSFMKNIEYVDVSPNDNIDITKQWKTIDGVKIKPGHLVLLRKQYNIVENDIYVVNNLYRLEKSNILLSSDKADRFSCSVKMGTNADKQFFLNTGTTIDNIIGFPTRETGKTFIEGQSYLIKSLINYNVFNSFTGDFTNSTSFLNIPTSHPTNVSLEIDKNLSIDSGKELLIYNDSDKAFKIITTSYESSSGILSGYSISNVGTYSGNTWIINNLEGQSKVIFTDYDVARKQLQYNQELYFGTNITVISGLTLQNYVTIKYHNSLYSVREGTYDNMITTGLTSSIINDVNGTIITFINDFDVRTGDSTKTISRYSGNTLNDYLMIEMFSGDTKQLELFTFVKSVSGNTFYIEDVIPNWILKDLINSTYKVTNLTIASDWNDAIYKLSQYTPFSDFFTLTASTSLDIFYNITIEPKDCPYNQYFDYGDLMFIFTDNEDVRFFDTNNQYINYKLLDRLNEIDRITFQSGFTFFNKYLLSSDITVRPNIQADTYTDTLIISTTLTGLTDIFKSYTYVYVAGYSDQFGSLPKEKTLVYEVYDYGMIIERPKNWPKLTFQWSYDVTLIENIDGLKNISDILYEVYMNEPYDNYWYIKRTDNEKKYIAEAYADLLKKNETFRSKVTGLLYQNFNNEFVFSLFNINATGGTIDNNLYYSPIELIFIGADRKTRLPVPISFEGVSSIRTEIRQPVIHIPIPTSTTTTTTTIAITTTTTTILPTTTTTTTILDCIMDGIMECLYIDLDGYIECNYTPMTTTTTIGPYVDIYYGVSSNSIVTESEILNNFYTANGYVGSSEGRLYVFDEGFYYKYWVIPNLPNEGYRVINKISNLENYVTLAYSSYYSNFQENPYPNEQQSITYGIISINGVDYRIYRSIVKSSLQLECYVYSI